MKNLFVQWRFKGRQRSAVLIEFNSLNEIRKTAKISVKVAEILISKGVDSGS